jgi:predicted Holliday junction resolvase-like endonuclease
MFFLKVVEFIAFVVIVALVVTQVVIPMLFNEPVFWFFRKKAKKKIEELTQDLKESESEAEAGRLRDALSKAMKARSCSVDSELEEKMREMVIEEIEKRKQATAKKKTKETSDESGKVKKSGDKKKA